MYSMQDFAGVCYFACFSCGETNRNRTAQSIQASSIGSSSSGGGIGGGGGGIVGGGIGVGAGLGAGAERDRAYPLEVQGHRGSGIEWGGAGNISEDRLGGFLLPSGYEMSLMLRYRLGMGARARHGQVSRIE